MGRNAQSATRFHRMRSVHAPYLFGAATQFIPQKGIFIFQEGKLKLPLRENFKMLQRTGCRLALSLDKIGGASEEKKNKQATTSLAACTIFG